MFGKYLIVVCLSLLASLSGIITFSSKSLTSDKQLTEHFYEHQASFEEVVKMANQDSSVRSISYDHVFLNDYETWENDNQEGFSTKRWKKYKELYKQIGLFIHSISKEKEMLKISSASIAVSDKHPLLIDKSESIVISKGYVYSLKEPAPLVKTLDNMGFDSNEGIYYKKIGEHWYLYFDWGVSKPE